MGWVKNQRKRRRRGGDDCGQLPAAYVKRKRGKTTGKQHGRRPSKSVRARAWLQRYGVAEQPLQLPIAPVISAAEQDRPTGQSAGEQILVAPEAVQGLKAKEPPKRLPSGLTAKEEQELIARAVANDWQGKAGWPTGWSSEDFRKKAMEGPLTMKERTALAVLRDVGQDTDAKLRQVAARNAISMEGQNISDRHNTQRMDYHERALTAKGIGNSGPDLHLHLHGDASSTVQAQHRRAAALEAISAELALRNGIFEHGGEFISGAGDSYCGGIDPDTLEPERDQG